MNFTTKALANVKASASAMISEKSKIMRAAGEDIIDLGLGEPDFETPPHIVEAAHQAALNGETRYPPTGGTQKLKQAIQAKFKNDNQLDYAPDEIIVSNGAKQVIFNSFMATLEKDDEVILCAPYFDSYRNIINLIGGIRRVVNCKPEQNFCLTPNDLENAITDKTRWLLLNAPSNPSGTAYDMETLQRLGKILEKYPNILIMSDEIYEHIIFDKTPFVSFAHACPNLKHRILTVNGVSKAYAMTGWRIGYGAGPKELIKAMVTVQSQISSGACSIAQAGAYAALTGEQQSVSKFREAFERRRDLVVRMVAQIEGLSLITPKGAFYTLINCNNMIGRTSDKGVAIEDDVAFVDFLLQEAGVACVPGSVYEMAGHFRISTANADDSIKSALERIALACSKLS